MTDKKLTDQQLLGSQGTGLIELRVSQMGFVWRPTSQHDTGIDGEIELRDTTNGRMTGLIIKVQSKAVSNFQNETDEGFDFSPEARDVRYWLSHNVPVILIVSRPRTNELYWTPLQERAGSSSASNRIHFVKAHDKLDNSAKARLIELAQAMSPGAMAPALEKPEALVSNLLPVIKLPERLFLAETQFKDTRELGESLRGTDLRIECILKNKRILTVRDLTDPRYATLCDRGTVEDFAVDEWAYAKDPDKQRDFVRLMNRCLREMLRTMPERIWFDNKTACYFFPPSESRNPYDYAYRGEKKETGREVFKERINKAKGHVMGYRHSAMKAQFLRFKDCWYLEITPTYFFTWNGKEQSKYHEEWLKGIKELEKNGAVRGQLLMWADILLNPPDLFGGSYPFLGFGVPMSFKTSRGIDDAAWTASEKSGKHSHDEHSLTLFELL